jgi:hypothetical protein
MISIDSKFYKNIDISNNLEILNLKWKIDFPNNNSSTSTNATKIVNTIIYINNITKQRTAYELHIYLHRSLNYYVVFLNI